MLRVRRELRMAGGLRAEGLKIEQSPTPDHPGVYCYYPHLLGWLKPAGGATISVDRLIFSGTFHGFPLCYDRPGGVVALSSELGLDAVGMPILGLSDACRLKLLSVSSFPDPTAGEPTGPFRRITDIPGILVQRSQAQGSGIGHLVRWHMVRCNSTLPGPIELIVSP